VLQSLRSDHLVQRICALILYTSYFIVSYKAIQGFTATYASPVNLALPFEKQIPFIPWSFYVYSLAYPFPAILLFVCDHSQIKKIVLTFIGVSLIHYIIFLLFPISYPFRPELSAESQDWTINLIHQFYGFDSTLNSFPSIHVSFVMMTYYFLRQMKSEWTRLGYALAYTISISTILVKQHYIVDVLGGLIIAYIISKLTRLPYRN